jgi:hypothetical protein
MSLSACFEKKERLLWESGKGVWWVVNEAIEGGEQAFGKCSQGLIANICTGTKRERKRNRPTRAEKQANPELYPPKPNAVTLPTTAPTVARFEILTPELIESRSSLAPAQQSTIAAPSVPTVDPPWTAVATSVPDTGSTHLSLPRPVSVAPTVSNGNHSFRHALPSSSIIPFSRPTTSSRPTFVSRRDEQGTDPMRGVVHTRWQSSGDLPFDVTHRETGSNDASDSEDDDD